MELTGLPAVDATLIFVFWATVAWKVADALSKNLDQDLLKAKWPPWAQWAVPVTARLMRAAHHWILGGFMFIYLRGPVSILGYTFENAYLELPAIGLGLIISDRRDLPGVLRDVFGAVIDAIVKQRGPAK